MTHEGGNTLDIFITNTTEIVSQLEVQDPLENCDHFPIFAKITGPKKDECSVQEFPDWTKADLSKPRENIGNKDWERGLWKWKFCLSEGVFGQI